jgi:hypothetical protein
MSGLSNKNNTTFAGTLYMPSVLQARSSFLRWRKTGHFLSKKITVLMCLDSSPLMQLMVVMTKGKKATEVGPSLHSVTPWGGLIAKEYTCCYLFCLKVLQRFKRQHVDYPGSRWLWL